MSTRSQDLQLVAPSAQSGGKTPLAASRTALAKRAYATRRVPPEHLRTLRSGDLVPRPGDLVLARVERLRQHQKLELADGRRATLHPGDEIIVAYGHRYAPDQFHAVVPQRLGACHLVAAGGIAAEAVARNERVKPATEIFALGVIADERGRRINLRDYALPDASATPAAASPLVIAVAGSSMNAGKTTTAAFLVRGLRRAGIRASAAKVTGTAAGGDAWQLLDAGAERMLDFTDAGHASTYCLPQARVEEVFRSLLQHLAADAPQVIVVEVADGLLQDETSRLLRSEVFRCAVDGVLFAAGDSLSALYGANWLEAQGLPLRAVSGAIALSPLACREAEAVLEVPLIAPAALLDGDTAAALVVRESAAPGRSGAAR